jgi:hypothetical protein
MNATTFSIKFTNITLIMRYFSSSREKTLDLSRIIREKRQMVVRLMGRKVVNEQPSA